MFLLVLVGFRLVLGVSLPEATNTYKQQQAKSGGRVGESQGFASRTPRNNQALAPC